MATITSEWGFSIPTEGLAEFVEAGCNEYPGHEWSCTVHALNGNVVASGVICKTGCREFFCEICNFDTSTLRTFSETTLRKAMKRTTKALKTATKNILVQPFTIK